MSAVMFIKLAFFFLFSTAKGQGPPPQLPTSGPGEPDSTLAAALQQLNYRVCLNTNSVRLLQDGTASGHPTRSNTANYCYLFNYLSMRTSVEARADCVNQGGDLVSITDLYEQAFIQGGPIFTAVHFCVNGSVLKYLNTVLVFVSSNSLLCVYFKKYLTNQLKNYFEMSKIRLYLQNKLKKKCMLVTTRGRQRLFSKDLLHFSTWCIYSLNLVVLLFWTG